MSATVDITEASWKGVADELASALRATILRNPNVSRPDWERAQIALGHYEVAAGEPPAPVPPPD
jgi:hypothetical protein